MNGAYVKPLDRYQVMEAVGANTVATFQRWKREGKLPDFPNPVTPGHWDPEAVEAWRRSRIPKHLRAAAGIAETPANDPGADPTLAERAMALAGDG